MLHTSAAEEDLLLRELIEAEEAAEELREEEDAEGEQEAVEW